MPDEYQEELINISEKLGKYNAAMQESLNILSDEFLLLRDELSTLNQNLEKTKDLDERIEQFNKTVTMLTGLQEKLKVIEKVADSMAIADSLSARIDVLAKKADEGKAGMAEAVQPISKKMDLLFSKFDETLTPVGKKVDVLSEAFKEELKESSETLKGEEQLKSLALAIQDELSRLQKVNEDHSNAIRSVSTSVAFLSSSEGEMKKSLDGLIKIYEQDRERSAEERAKRDAEEKGRGGLNGDGRLDEIVALLKVQMEKLESSEGARDGRKPQGLEEIALEMKAQTALLQTMSQQKSAIPPELVEEIRKQGADFSKMQQMLAEQARMLAFFQDSLPTGNFEEVIKHADLINQSTNSKLDSLTEMNSKTTKAIWDFADKSGQLPALMQNISAALDALVNEMRKAQAAYKNLENAVDKAAALPAQSSTEHMQKLETITENIRGLHASIETPPQIEGQLRQVIDELRKFEQIEMQRLEKTTAGADAVGPAVESKLNGIFEELRKIEGLQIGISEKGSVAGSGTPIDTSRMDAQLIAIKKELATVSENVTGLRNMLMQGTDISAEVDFAPVITKIEQLREQIASSAAAAGQRSSASAQLSGSKLLDQREVFEEIQQNIRVFQSFELSDRAKIVVDRLDMLVKRGISLYST